MTTVYAMPAAVPAADGVYGDPRRRQTLLSAGAPSSATHSRAPSATSGSLRAPSATPSHRSPSPASAHTDPESVNPYAAFANNSLQPEVHVVKVTEDSVLVESGPPREGFFGKVGLTLSKLPGIASDADLPISPPGPPPPSPPASRGPSPTREYEHDDDHRGGANDASAPIAREHVEKTLAQPLPTPAPLQTHSEPTPAPISLLTAAAPHPSQIMDSSTQSTSPVPLHSPRVAEGSFVPPHRKQQLRPQDAPASPPRMQARSESGSVTFEDPPAEPSGSRHPSRFQSSSAPSASPLLMRSSTDSRTGHSTDSPRAGGSRLRSSLGDEYSGDEQARARGSMDAPGGSSYLHPPPTQMHRPTRRNTTGSNVLFGAKNVQDNAVARVGPGVLTEEPDPDVVLTLASDIELQAEQIRRERQSKREKAQRDAEAALTRSGSKSTMDENRPLVGNLIGEDHVNYVMMYNMLTGIRIAVSRCQAKIKRPLTDEDFTARHKYSFDVIGNELTPSAKYDFKFKDYAPFVFRELREDYFHLDPADYLLSLTAKYILSELGSPGKSGSFFYFSRDYRFIIKTIHHSEHKFLRSVLKDYHRHVKENPHTLISRFYGLHRVKLPRGRKIHFVIMNNLFPPHKDVHETYDLKGSTVGREYPEDKARENKGAVLKDMNWINRGKWLEFGPEKRALLTEQLRRDSELLKRLHVMDYSLLVGIHNVRRGNKENLRSNTLKVFSPDMPPIRRKPTQHKGGKSPEAIAMRRAMRESDPKRLTNDLDLPEEDTGERQHFVFYQDDGGMRATDEQEQPMDTIYYLGVIDILTPYSTLKKLEHIWKGLKDDRHKISPVPPAEYGDRFFSFMKAVMRGGGGGAPFVAGGS